MSRPSLRLAAVLAVTAGVACGCNQGSPAPEPTPFGVGSTTDVSSSTPTSSPRPAPVDYRKLLLQPEDMVRPNSGYTAPKPATLNPRNIPGAEVLLVSNDGTNAVGITVVLLTDASTAPAELSKAVANLVTVRPDGPPTPFDIGDEAYTVVGTSPDGTQSATALVYRYRQALVRIDFYGLPGASTPLSTVTDIGQKQTAVLRVGLDTVAAPG